MFKPYLRGITDFILLPESTVYVKVDRVTVASSEIEVAK